MTLPAHDVVLLLAISAGASVVVTALGLGLLRAARRRPLRDAAIVVALTPVLTVVAAAAGATSAMFLSTEQFGVLIAMVAFAGIGGLLTAMVLARTIMRGSESLRIAASALTRGEPYVAPGGTPSAELEALAAELEIAHAKLEEARRHERAVEGSRRDLIAWVSHDLRTPLAGIRAMAEALEDDVVSTDDDRALYHQRIRVEVARLSRMVDDLFELSRIHAGTLSLSPRPVPLADVVQEAVSTAEPVASANDVRLDLHLDLGAARSPAVVEVDPYAMTRVVGNLLGNAIRHTPPAGRVRVETARIDGSAVLSVSDECGGIAAADLERVFDVAYRGSAARTPVPDGGAGLGLAIARGIVQAHGGRIGVENVGPGCRFTVLLPLTARPLTGRSLADDPPAGQAGAGEAPAGESAARTLAREATSAVRHAEPGL